MAARSAPPSPASGHGLSHLHHPVGAASGIKTNGRIEERVKEERRNE